MPTPSYGPVEMYLFGIAGEHPDATTVAAVHDLVQTNLIRLLDVVLLRRDVDGALTHIEWEDDANRFGFERVAPEAAGLVGHDDLAELGETIAPGSSAVLVVVELTFQRRLAAAIADTSELLAYERIPAPIVNALVDVLTVEED